MFGEIQMFADCSTLGTVIFLTPFVLTGENILKRAGPPCREVLETYANIGLLSKFIVEVLPISNSTSIVIQAKDIVTNCILVKSSFYYIVKMPNNYEHH